MNGKKRVLLFVESLGSGGAERQVSNLAVSLKENGYDVKVMIYLNNLFYKPMLDKEEIPVISCAGNKLTRLFRVRKAINKAKPDVVIAFLEGACFMACVSKIGKKWKLITTERNAKKSTFESRRNKFYNKFEKYSDAKMANSFNAINMWKAHYPQYSDKYTVIYNRISIPSEILDIPHEYRESGKTKMVVAASYQGLKNPIALVEAVNLLTDEQKEKIYIDWYGQSKVVEGTEIYDTARANVEKYGLSKVVSLNEETKEIYKKMAESDAVGLFSTVEGLPNVICEGMTIGRPVVMSTVSDYGVLVTDNGYLCDPNSIESIRDALVKLIETPTEELKKMGESSKQKAKELFSAEVIEKQWIDLIEKVSN